MTKGQRVEVEFQEFPGRRFPGVILEARKGGMFRVSYESWGVQFRATVPAHRIHAV